jgi:hypothetical protein
LHFPDDGIQALVIPDAFLVEASERRIGWEGATPGGATIWGLL